MEMNRPSNPLDTFHCIEWDGSLVEGYARISLKGKNWKNYRVQRLVYEEVRGPIPEGLQIDHLCRNRACINVDHLEAVTQQENIRRGEAGANQRNKKECPSGHPYSGPNLYVCPSGRRHCRECMRKRNRVFQAKRRAS